MTLQYRDYTGTIVQVSSAQTRNYWGNGVSSSLYGSGTDDTFHVYSQTDQVFEKAGALSTVVASVWNAHTYVLPANVLNLTVSGAVSTAVGNALDNLIVADGSTGMTLDGGAGDDVLVGNSGANTFMASVGTGHDVIYNFKAATDMLRVASFTSFDAVKAAMVQSGADVVITLDAKDSVTLRNTTVQQLHASNFELGLNTSGLKQTFADEFSTFTSSPDGSKGWMTSFPYTGLGARTMKGSGDLEYYSDSSVGVNPFSDSNGVLSITATPAKPGVTTPAGSGLTYTSGLITTYKSFSQLYGYFEVKAQLPAGQGMWPGFWLLPTKGPWPPEIDVLEHYGNDPTTVYQTAHTDDGGFNTSKQVASYLANASGGFHTYGVDWEADKITWYVDRVAVGQIATPSDMHVPMYMLVNLAVGGPKDISGVPDGTSSQTMRIDSVKAYSSIPGGAVAPAVTITAQVLASDTGASRTDNVTSNGKVTLSGTVSGPSGTSVTIYDGSTKLGTATPDAQHAWSFTTTLANGAHALHATASDAAGQTGTSAAARALTVDTSRPQIAVTAVSQSATTTGETITGTVSGAASGVTVYNGQTSLGAATLDGKGGWSFTKDLGPGSFELTAVASDLAGNTTSADASFTATARAKSLQDTLVLNVAEDAYEGNAQFTVSVDGAQVGGVYSTTALHSSDQSQDISLKGSFGPGPHTVTIDYFNDLYGGAATADRNLYVNSIALNGRTTVVNTMQYEGGSESYAVPSASKADILSVNLSGDAYKGNAQFTVSVDGVQVGGLQSVSAQHDAGETQTFDLAGYFGAGSHDVAVDFKNDLFGGTAATDRNLYVNAIALNGATTTENAKQTRSGTAHYAVEAGTTASTAGLEADAGSVLVLGNDTAAPSVKFGGPNATLQLTSPEDFTGAISGFGASDVIDLRSFAYSSPSASSLTYADKAGGGTLSLSDGQGVVHLSMLGSYAANSFRAASDGLGGTALSFVSHSA